MTEDPNFSGNCLRLASFLRVVDIELPQRPSRFKRRFTAVKDQPQQPFQSSATHSRSSPGVNVAELSLNSDICAKVLHRVSPTNSQHRVYESADINEKTSRLTFTGQRISRSNINDANYQIIADQNCTKESLIEPEQNPTAAVHLPESKETSAIRSKSPNTRQRRSPVLGLALTRTTTADGLPTPSDEKLLSLSITESDPIDDSQNVVAGVHKKRNQVDFSSTGTSTGPKPHDIRSPGERNPSERRPQGDRIKKNPYTSSPYPSKRSKGAKCTTKNLVVQKSHKYEINISLVNDGFVGDELNHGHRTKPKRRPKRPQPVVLPGSVRLSLAGGSLPVPGSYQEISSNHTACSNNLSALIGTEVPTENDDALHQDHVKVRDNEIDVCGQFLCITAPDRQDSESSASGSCVDEEFTEEDYAEDV